MVDAVLAELDPVFDEMYMASGRSSVPPETLLTSTVLMAMYSIRSERAFCERLSYDVLFKWFLDMRIDDRAFDATTFTKNRERLLDAEVADESFAAVVRQAKLRRYVSSDHFSVDGTLLNAWASHKSFKPKDGPPSDPPAGRNTEVAWHGQKRSNDTHASTADPEARLYRKSNNTAATPCYAGHLLIEHRSALIVDAELTTADGYGERATALEMLARLPKSKRRRTVAGDKNYDTRDFVAKSRQLGFTARVAQNLGGNRRSAIGGCTTRHPGYTVSQRIRKRVEEPFGWRRRPQAALHRPATQPSLVQDERGGQQPDPDHRPRQPTRLTDPTRSGSGSSTGANRDGTTSPAPPSRGHDQPAGTAISPQPAIFRTLLIGARNLTGTVSVFETLPGGGASRRQGTTTMHNDVTDGDRRLRLMVAEHGRAVEAFLLAVEHDVSVREDLRVDVFDLVYHHLDELASLAPAQVRVWLIRTARNLTANAGRRAATRVRLLERLARQPIEFSASAEDEYLETEVADRDRQQAHRLHQAWSQLSDGYRQILRMNALGHNGPAIAQQLGISHQAARSRLMRARNAFFTAFQAVSTPSGTEPEADQP